MKPQPVSDVPWRPDFCDALPMYAPIRHLAAPYRRFGQWPELADYQRQLDSLPAVHTLNGQRLRIVEQAGKPRHFHEHYAPRIFYSGELQTRRHNWHDFFQFLTWLAFPRSKAVINALHIPLARRRLEQAGERGRRSPMENLLSLFDEGGVVILSSEPALLDHIRRFEWKTLFWKKRQSLQQQLRCITFGHALYEKGLRPYLGMTANAILLPVEQEVLEQPPVAQCAWLDATLAGLLQKGKHYTRPRDLSPFPVLGMPGWMADNACEHFYDNRQYFRSGRRTERPSATAY